MNIIANFVVEFPLKTEKYQEDILNKRFEIGRKIYNSLNSSLRILPVYPLIYCIISDGLNVGGQFKNI